MRGMQDLRVSKQLLLLEFLKINFLGCFFLGFLISLAMNVTLFHASDENNELMIVAPSAPIKAKPVYCVMCIFPESFTTVFVASQAL